VVSLGVLIVRRTLSSQSLIKDRWIDIRADHCQTPSGLDVSPYYVLSYVDWVHVVALTPERGLVLVKQYRHAVGEWFLEIPGGGVDSHDGSIEQAARRELAEETGYTSERWFHVTTLYLNPATHTNRVHTYLALDAVTGHERRLDPGEEGLATLVMPFADVLEGLEASILGQAMHVASVSLAARVLARL
jgi:8-oxo-dGTP pyrophosphatase MutT (NUDIX family)